MNHYLRSEKMRSTSNSLRREFCFPVSRSLTIKRRLTCASALGELEKTDSKLKREVPRSRPVWIQQQLADEQLESTPKQQALVLGSFGLNLFILTRGLSELASWEGSASAGLAVLLGYLISDLLSGVYHWGIDNYGSKETPVFGKQIDGFQRHHRFPWTITYRQFCNNVHPICIPAIAVSSIFTFLSFSPMFDVFYSTGCGFVILSQQCHAWAHTKPSELSSWVLNLQKAGILISTGAHGLHHRKPFNNNYCIVSGIWNPLLDQSEVFYWMERVIYLKTGVKPRSWDEGHEHDEEVAYFVE